MKLSSLKFHLKSIKYLQIKLIKFLNKIEIIVNNYLKTKLEKLTFLKLAKSHTFTPIY
jgi:hypothetical protein